MAGDTRKIRHYGWPARDKMPVSNCLAAAMVFSPQIVFLINMSVYPRQSICVCVVCAHVHVYICVCVCVCTCMFVCMDAASRHLAVIIIIIIVITKTLIIMFLS